MMSIKEKIEEMETKMNDAWDHVLFEQDGVSYEEITDAYKFAFSAANNVFNEVIKLLKQLDNQKDDNVNS